MKKKQLLLGLMMVLVLTGCAVSAEQLAERARMSEQVTQELGSRHYKIMVHMMYPLRGTSVNVDGSSYSLEVKGDTLVSYLPYRGVARSVAYGGGSGLVFTSAISQYDVQKDRKGNTVVSFRSNSEDDQFLFHVQVFPNGHATVDVSSRERDPISFSGTLEVE
ncbi:MAG: DUF4251 domain-containing protein [Prevotella sp.]|nr:DUF4251 domain-containing protein [Prevotella sp.]